MADTYLSELAKKDNPSDSDIMLLEDSEDTKRIDYNKLADAILNKLTNKTYSTLNTSNKTLPGAINGLNADLMGKTFLYNTQLYSNFTISVKNAGQDDWSTRTGFILFVVQNSGKSVALMIGYNFRGTNPDSMWTRSFFTDTTINTSATMDSCTTIIGQYGRLLAVPMNSQNMTLFDFSLS